MSQRVSTPLTQARGHRAPLPSYEGTCPSPCQSAGQIPRLSCLSIRRLPRQDLLQHRGVRRMRIRVRAGSAPLSTRAARPNWGRATGLSRGAAAARGRTARQLQRSWQRSPFPTLALTIGFLRLAGPPHHPPSAPTALIPPHGQEPILLARTQCPVNLLLIIVDADLAGPILFLRDPRQLSGLLLSGSKEKQGVGVPIIVG